MHAAAHWNPNLICDASHHRKWHSIARQRSCVNCICQILLYSADFWWIYNHNRAHGTTSITFYCNLAQPFILHMAKPGYRLQRYECKPRYPLKWPAHDCPFYLKWIGKHHLVKQREAVILFHCHHHGIQPEIAAAQGWSTHTHIHHNITHYCQHSAIAQITHEQDDIMSETVQCVTTLTSWLTKRRSNMKPEHDGLGGTRLRVKSYCFGLLPWGMLGGSCVF